MKICGSLHLVCYVSSERVTELGKKNLAKINKSEQKSGIMALQGTTKYTRTINFKRGNRGRTGHRSIVH